MHRVRSIKTMLAVLFVAAACLLCVGCNSSASQTEGEAPSLTNEVTGEEGMVYTLYVGLADRDSGKQEITMDEAIELLKPVFAEAGSGFTMVPGYGGYMNEEGEMVENDTVVCQGIHGEEQAIIELIGMIKEKLNIESVYCESQIVGFGIYGGTTSEVG